MNTVIEWANGAAMQWAGRMWPVLWQTAVLAGIVGLIVLSARRTSPALRFWLWMLVPLRLLVMPLIAITLPVLPHSPAAPPDVVITPPNLVSQLGAEATPTNWTAQPMSLAERPSTTLQGRTRVSIRTWLMAGWVAGIGFFSLRLARGWLRMREIAGQARESSDARVRDCAREAAAMLGLWKPPRIMSAEEGVSPFVLGFLRPVVVLPAALADRVSPEELRTVLAHEFAHVRRRDAITGWVLACCDVIYFFNPVVHLVKRVIMLERERACDEQVLALAQAPRAVYARALLSATGLNRPAAMRLSCAPVLLESGQHLERRLKSIAAETRPCAALSRAAKFGLLAIMLLALPGVTLTARTATAPATLPTPQAPVSMPATLPVESKTKTWTKTLEARERVLRVGFPLPLGESFVFDNPSDVLQGRLTLRITRERTPEHAAATYEYAIFENGKLAEGWKVNRPIGRAKVGLNSQFFSTDRHLTAPDDVLEMEFVAAKDLHGRGSIETGFLPVGTYKAKGKYAALTDDYDSVSYLREYVKDGEKPSPKVLEGLELTRAANEWRAWLTDWNAEWPLTITAKGGWLRSAEQISIGDEAAKQAIAVYDANQRSRMMQERAWTRKFIVADQGSEAACRVNLFEIVHALATYQEPHHDLYPSALADLFPNYIEYPDALVCSSAQTSPSLANGMPCSYRYLGPVLPTDAFPGLFVIYDRPGNHGEGRNVGLFDGQVKFYKEVEFKTVLAAQYERLKPVIVRADFPGNRERVKAFFEDKDFSEPTAPAVPSAAPPTAPASSPLERKIAAVALPGVTIMEAVQILRVQVKGANFVIDPQAARDQTTITLELRNVTLAQALEAMLKGPKLDFAFADNVIYISTAKGCMAYAQYAAPALPGGQAGHLQELLNGNVVRVALPGVTLQEAVEILKVHLRDLPITIDPALFAKHDQLLVTLDLTDVPLRVILKNILVPNGLEYTFVGEGICIKEKAPAAPAEKPN